MFLKNCPTERKRGKKIVRLFAHIGGNSQNCPTGRKFALFSANCPTGRKFYWT